MYHSQDQNDLKYEEACEEAGKYNLKSNQQEKNK
jgi:hypothetical protein